MVLKVHIIVALAVELEQKLYASLPSRLSPHLCIHMYICGVWLSNRFSFIRASPRVPDQSSSEYGHEYLGCLLVQLLVVFFQLQSYH